ncbi:MAG: hypothetical protein HY901_36840 [Deltaproteobacteria bacterium]|nr:hypothetical protein [Deltaproteobacteria bacterium]
MAMCHSVTRRKATSCVFPDRCVVCGREHPGNAVRVSSKATGWYTIVFWMAGSKFTVDVPACQVCGRAFLRQRRLRMVATWAATLVGVLLALRVLRHYEGSGKSWLAMGLALLAISPWFLWQMFSAPAFDLTVGDKKVDYEFRDQVYASEFAELNGEAQ